MLTSLQNPQSFEYIEDKKAIPNHENLKIYLTSYSDKTGYAAKDTVYYPEIQKWNNFIAGNEAFLIVSTTTLPTSIKYPLGLDLKNRTLNGVRSDMINQADYILGSFSASFYLKFKDLTFEDGESKPIELLDIYVETPNYVKVQFEAIPGDADNLNIILHVGGPQNRYDIRISKDTLKSNGNLVLFTVVYDASSKPKPTLVCYLGETQYEKIIDPAPQIYLGNSRMRINGSGNLDASLHAFMFFKSALTAEHQKSLKEYLEKQQSGVNNILRMVGQLTDGQLAQIKSLLSDQTLSLEELRKQLQTCQTSQKETVKVPEAFKYKIQMDGWSSITPEDLQSCSVLNIKKRTGTARTTVGTATGTTKASEAEEEDIASQKEYFQLDEIPFLKGVTPKEADLSQVLKGYFTREGTA